MPTDQVNLKPAPDLDHPLKETQATQNTEDEAYIKLLALHEMMKKSGPRKLFSGATPNTPIPNPPTYTQSVLSLTLTPLEP